MFYTGQKLKNSPFDIEPSFEIIKIFQRMGSDETTYYRLKNINTNKIQETTEEFLYPCS